ncbi:hypothetical protein ACI3KX_19015 [Microbacterium sp. ZW CA_36]|uniref:hypothetical protein n=1 Tax=Microbacterium sp. ZW CA_36 TaxID=3378078 RepID=UPI00385483EA
MTRGRLDDPEALHAVTAGRLALGTAPMDAAAPAAGIRPVCMHEMAPRLSTGRHL